MALAAERAGNLEQARAILARASEAFPDSAPLVNSAGNLAMKAGNPEVAEVHFRRAAELAPGEIEFALNRAVALAQLARHGEVIAALAPHEEAGRASARYCSARGASERAVGNMAQAARWYDLCIELDPARARGLHGRARVAIERGEDNALERFERALTVNPGDADLWLGKAQALDVAGRAAEARQITEQIVAQAPRWVEGLKFLAQLRLAAGEDDFAGHYGDAARKLSQDPYIPAAHCEILAGLDRAAEAADVAAEARKRFPSEPHFALLEAVHAGSAGEWDRAEAIFADLHLSSTERHLHEARHRIRAGDIERAEVLLQLVLDGEPWSISAWALVGVVWRLSRDDRAGWLHGQERLIQRLALRCGDALVDRVTGYLRELHAGSPLPLGQSLRGGTQTRGILFDRPNPVLAELHEAILATLADYRAALPPYDETHPLLRHAESEMQLAGSWSVRLAGGGDFHTAHIHPQGILSSALYLVVPEDAAGPKQLGWLEIGRPPPDLRLDLPPIETIRPEPGYLALFPSTLYHGTTPFGQEERMTVAFDVVPVAGSAA